MNLCFKYVVQEIEYVLDLDNEDVQFYRFSFFHKKQVVHKIQQSPFDLK